MSQCMTHDVRWQAVQAPWAVKRGPSDCLHAGSTTKSRQIHELGNGTNTDSSTPVSVSGAANIALSLPVPLSDACPGFAVDGYSAMSASVGVLNRDGARTAGSIRTKAVQHRSWRVEQDLEIPPERPRGDVQIVELTQVSGTQLIAARNLPEARNARANLKSTRRPSF